VVNPIGVQRRQEKTGKGDEKLRSREKRAPPYPRPMMIKKMFKELDYNARWKD